MAPGRPALDPETKATRRQASLRRYAEKYTVFGSRRHLSGSDIFSTRNRDSLRDAARLRMQALRARTAGATTEQRAQQRLKANGAAAKYRETAKIRKADIVRRAKPYIAAHGSEAFNEKQERAYMKITQKRHEGRPILERARSTKHKHRHNPREVLTDNQKRCRALRAMGFEEDNGDNSDEELLEGVCGCDRTECQRAHVIYTAEGTRKGVIRPTG
ncbi:hypothetical protein DFH06DRAFT_1349481 [Mycena polygramma]|nr:hypothetical protein DFH06DRAFT_1349481 [Mycena polygramma]